MSNAASNQHITLLLSRWRCGDGEAMAELSLQVYDTLHHLAYRYMQQERNNHTLQPTALVHEAFINLLNADVDYQDKLHFYRLAGSMMRRILVDHARARLSSKRGDGYYQVELTGQSEVTADPANMLALHRALSALAEFDELKAQILELQFFAGLTTAQIAQLYGVSDRTIERGSKMAKAWVYQSI